MPGLVGQSKYRDASWVRQQLSAILNFWYPAAVDRRYGGYLNLLDADGSVLDGEQKHLVASARFAVLFSMGVLAGGQPEWCKQAATDAIDFIWRAHRDPHTVATIGFCAGIDQRIAASNLTVTRSSFSRAPWPTAPAWPADNGSSRTPSISSSGSSFAAATSRSTRRARTSLR